MAVVRQDIQEEQNELGDEDEKTTKDDFIPLDSTVKDKPKSVLDRFKPKPRKI